MVRCERDIYIYIYIYICVCVCVCVCMCVCSYRVLVFREACSTRYVGVVVRVYDFVYSLG
jgi:hypothetical protein